MGRGDLTRTIHIVAAVVAAAASTAAATTGIHWTTLASGRTEPGGKYQPNGFIAVTKAQETRFASRLDAPARASLAKINLQRTGVVAVFLDGMPCGRDIAVTRVVRNATTVTVTIRWTRPPIGMAMCVRTSTPYVVIGVARASLGRPAAAHVKVVAIARA